MTDSVYKFIELVGTSTESWEKASEAVLNKATKTLRDLRIAEVTELDMQIDNGKVVAYRAKVKASFRIERLDEQNYKKDPASWFVEKEHSGFDG